MNPNTAEKTVSVTYQCGAATVTETLTGTGSVGTRKDDLHPAFIVLFAGARTFRVREDLIISIDMITPPTS